MADAEFTREFGFDETEEQLVRYLEDVAKFRESYFEKMGSLGLPEDQAWAYFELDQPDWPEEVWTDVCLYHVTRIKTRHNTLQLPAPQIRLISSEGYSVDEHHEYFTTDVTVDYEDDAVYMVGVSSDESSDETDSADEEKTQEDKDGDEEKKTLVPTFFVVQNSLVIKPKEYLFTTDPYVIPYTAGREEGKEPQEDKIIPFGGFDRLSDKVHALSVARKLLDMVSDYEPRAKFKVSE